MKILFISYNFPPEGGPAVQRVSKFIKYLNKLDIKTYVLTAQKKLRIKDESLLKDIEGCQVYRTKDYSSLVRGEFKKFLKSYLIPDKNRLWALTAVKKGIELVKNEEIDVIISTSPPHSTHIVAQKIAAKTNIRWLIDFRDEWSNNSTFFKFPNQSKQKELESEVLTKCDHVITVTKTAKNNFEKLIDEDKISVIYNGYDEADFENVQITNDYSNNLPHKIMYAGRLNELHSPKNFFKALSELKENKLIDENKVSIEIIGSDQNKKWLNGSPELKEIVNFRSYLPHDELLNHLVKADSLLLLGTNMNETEFIPAKVYEYFRLNKKIVGIISSKGELWNMLQTYGNSYLALNKDINNIKKEILNLINHKNNNSKFNRDFINIYSRENQTEKLCTLLKNI